MTPAHDRLHAAALDALGDPTRRAILEIVAAGPCPVQDIADRLPVSRPAVSRHLRLLKAAELVEDEARGSQRLYRLRPEGVEAVRGYFEQLWGEAAARFRLAAENTMPATGTTSPVVGNATPSPPAPSEGSGTSGPA